MSVKFHNFEYSYVGPKGKPVFVPTEKGRAIGEELVELVRNKISFADHFYHYAPGGHIAALHAHRQNQFLAKVDIQNFFYSIARNRVGHALYDLGIKSPGNWAKWSTVKNPFEAPSYALPYGFVQSPTLATLVLSKSKVGTLVSKLAAEMTVSVYLDDIAISHDDESVVQKGFEALLASIDEAGFSINEKKVSGPAKKAFLFNCELEFQRSEVSVARRSEFYSVARSPESSAAFERYCLTVES